MTSSNPTCRFGPFSLDVARRTLWKDEQLISVGPKAVEVLACLVDRAGELVTKDELMARVWPDTFVEEANLSVQVSTLRKALGDQDDGRPYIETLPRRGYRFLGSVVEATAQAPPRSMAILPFHAAEPNPGEEYLGVGLADAIISRLATLGQILVRPTSAVAKFAGRDRDAARVARELGVDVVLDGRIQRDGERVRLTVQLVRAADGGVSWAETFDETFTRLFRVQDALAAQLARALALRVGASEHARLTEGATANGEAYQAHLRGRYFWNKLTPPWLLKAREAFARAVALDPSYARAYAALADTDVILAIYGEVPPHEALERARSAARRALELDNTLAEALIALAWVHVFADWSAADAEKHLERAVELQPHSAGAHQWHALFLALTGRLIEAMAEILAARSIDPLSLTVHTNLGLQHYLGGETDEELEEHRTTLELEPDFAIGHWALGLAYARKGSYADAIAAQERAVELTGGSPLMKTALARYCAQAGDTPRARALLDELVGLSSARYVSPYRLATIFSALGDSERAFAELERAVAERDLWLVWLAVDPMIDDLREDPRFPHLVRRVGFAADDSD
jgi:DNA-binding winged helix-turn-helix (wHTH) protein/tetratricopeptide (TPR) repeat protein